jgi:hypothetical protein
MIRNTEEAISTAILRILTIGSIRITVPVAPIPITIHGTSSGGRGIRGRGTVITTNAMGMRVRAGVATPIRRRGGRGSGDPTREQAIPMAFPTGMAIRGGRVTVMVRIAKDGIAPIGVTAG